MKIVKCLFKEIVMNISMLMIALLGLVELGHAQEAVKNDEAEISAQSNSGDEKNEEDNSLISAKENDDNPDGEADEKEMPTM